MCFLGATPSSAFPTPPDALVSVRGLQGLYSVEPFPPFFGGKFTASSRGSTEAPAHRHRKVAIALVGRQGRRAQINAYHAPAPEPLTAVGTAELAAAREAAAANSTQAKGHLLRAGAARP